MHEFVIGDTDFLLDGRPFRILSGALHYFRVHPDLWADRIDKARRMGLNTIETYVAWNAHAPAEGEFHLSGGLDLGRFLDLVYSRAALTFSIALDVGDPRASVEARCRVALSSLVQHGWLRVKEDRVAWPRARRTASICF